MEQLFKLITDYSPALGVGVFLTIVVIVLLSKFFGITVIVDKAKVVGDDRKITAVSGGVEKIKEQLSDIGKRLGEVEKEVSNRATRGEVHQLELAFTRLEGRIDAVSMTIQANTNSLTRIEEQMYAAAVRLRTGVS